MATEGPEADVSCPNECGHTGQRSQLQQHQNEECPKQIRQCRFPGCPFKGIQAELNEHEGNELKHHMGCLLEEVSKLSAGGAEAGEGSADRKDSLKRVVEAVQNLEPTVTQLQENYKELSILVQTMQVSSYDGTFVWKIPEVKRRIEEAKSGKTVSLYSAPFYTSRHGYKMCLRLYMDGDGSGKGTHLSFFLTLMKGEYDALLSWPFRQTISLVLLDQSRRKNIVQSFRPDPDSSSFQQPVNEMSVASGCPQFAPLSILEDPSYVKNDTMFLQCRVDCSGLEKI